MNSENYAKYAAGVALLGSVFALVWFKGLDVSVYVGLVSSALAALGVHASATGLSASTPKEPPHA